MAGRQGVFAPAFANVNKDSELRRKPFDCSDLSFSDLDLAFGCSLLFSHFSGAMTLEMSLAAKDFFGFLPENLVSALETVVPNVS